MSSTIVSRTKTGGLNRPMMCKIWVVLEAAVFGAVCVFGVLVMRRRIICIVAAFLSSLLEGDFEGICWVVVTAYGLSGRIIVVVYAACLFSVEFSVECIQVCAIVLLIEDVLFILVGGVNDAAEILMREISGIALAVGIFEADVHIFEDVAAIACGIDIAAEFVAEVVHDGFDFLRGSGFDVCCGEAVICDGCHIGELQRGALGGLGSL